LNSTSVACGWFWIMMASSYLLPFSANMDLWVRPGNKATDPQWKSPSSPHPMKAGHIRSSLKYTLIVFSIRGIVHYKFVPKGETREPVFLFTCSAASTRRCLAKTTQKVSHWGLVSSPQHAAHFAHSA
jgi:hypothetical protein